MMLIRRSILAGLRSALTIDARQASRSARGIGAMLLALGTSCAPGMSHSEVVKADWHLLPEDGIGSYENGAYGNAIRKLGDVAKNPQADDATRLKALKYLASSYCVSPDPPGSNATHLALCRQTFERALVIDADFDLAPGGRGHPIWSKEFAAARGIAKEPRSSSTRGASTSVGTAQVSNP